jgi:hypothetical protein
LQRLAGESVQKRKEIRENGTAIVLHRGGGQWQSLVSGNATKALEKTSQFKSKVRGISGFAMKFPEWMLRLLTAIKYGITPTSTRLEFGAMSLRKFATTAAVGAALAFTSASQAATPVVASAATDGKSDSIIGGLLFGAPFFVTIMGVTFVALITKVTVDNSTSP